MTFVHQKATLLVLNIHLHLLQRQELRAALNLSKQHEERVTELQGFLAARDVRLYWYLPIIFIF